MPWWAIVTSSLVLENYWRGEKTSEGYVRMVLILNGTKILSDLGVELGFQEKKISLGEN